jgi:hypothetical protein
MAPTDPATALFLQRVVFPCSQRSADIPYRGSAGPCEGFSSSAKGGGQSSEFHGCQAVPSPMAP